MIVTGGIFRGRKVKTHKTREVRPTSAKLRESIFNIICSMRSLQGAVVLDLFAGSGIVGIEALSRGAGKVYFVEKNHRAAALLKENLSNFETCYEVMVSDALQAIDRMSGEAFDIIFIDPPYASDLIELSLKKIAGNKLIKPDGLIITERSSGRNIDKLIKSAGFELIKSRNYGDSAIDILRAQF